MEVAEEILRNDCPLSVGVEYDAMNQRDRKSMLEALASALDMRVTNLVMHSIEHKTESGTTKPKDGPFVKRISTMYPRVEFNSEMIRNLQDELSSWGAVETSSSAKLAKYQQTVAAQKHQYAPKPGVYTCPSTSSAVTKKAGLATVNWNQLKRILFSELRLFRSRKGCFVEGAIVGEPIQPMVGGTTLIREKNTGDILMVCFYNFLPDGISGKQAEPMLSRSLPMGATLRIAEPFLKIFVDGSRGIRVDDPHELDVASGATMMDKVDEATAKATGNDLVKKKKYMAAADAYLSGIRSSELVPTLLSNRSQAFIIQNDWHSAFLDAAASLTIRPGSKKTWARYDLCLEKIKGDKANKTILQDLLKIKPISSSAHPTVDMSKAEEAKREGNGAFKQQLTQEAIEKWTAALFLCGEVVRAMLGNWALCALEFRNFGDVIAATTASLRIATSDKCIFRLSKALSFLGEYDLALGVLPISSSTESTFAELDIGLQRCTKYREIFKRGEAESPIDTVSLFFDTPRCLGNWQGDVETFLSKGKGRGLRATSAFDEGAVILVEWPLVAVATNTEDTKSLAITVSSKGTIDVGSSSLIRPTVVNRLKREAVLARVLSRLSDGSTHNPLVPLSDVLMNIEMFRLLLPTHREYLAEVEGVSADRVDKILDVNTHGHDNAVNDNEVKDVSTSTMLYPAVSMINHASNPNCAFAEIKLPQLAMIVACKDIKAGEELTMKYQTDEVVERKWGIKPET